jgi:hypothetical protein
LLDAPQVAAEEDLDLINTHLLLLFPETIIPSNGCRYTGSAAAITRSIPTGLTELGGIGTGRRLTILINISATIRTLSDNLTDPSGVATHFFLSS